MAAAEARAVWQRMATNRAVQEDVGKASKLAHCPSLKKQDSHSYYLGSSWGSMDTKVDLRRELNPSTHWDYRSDYLGAEDVLGSRFTPGLQALAAERGSPKSGSQGYMGLPSEYSVGNEVDLGWQFVLDPKPKSGYACETCEDAEDVGGGDGQPHQDQAAGEVPAHENSRGPEPAGRVLGGGLEGAEPGKDQAGAGASVGRGADSALLACHSGGHAGTRRAWIRRLAG